MNKNKPTTKTVSIPAQPPIKPGTVVAPIPKNIYVVDPIHDFRMLMAKANLPFGAGSQLERFPYVRHMKKFSEDYLQLPYEKWAFSNIVDLDAVPYGHELFPVFFMMKIIVTEVYILPGLLDFHAEHIKKEGNTIGAGKNKKEFKDFIELDILFSLKPVWSQEHLEKGFIIMNWLREKRGNTYTNKP